MTATNVRAMRFEKTSPTQTLAIATYRYRDGEKFRKAEVVVGMISDMAVADAAAVETLKEDNIEPKLPFFDPARRYLVMVYSHPRLEAIRGLPYAFECRAAYAHRPSRTQASDFLREYFGVPTVRRGDD